MSTYRQPCILVVTDEPLIRHMVARLLASEGYAPLGARPLPLRAADGRPYRLIIPGVRPAWRRSTYTPSASGPPAPSAPARPTMPARLATPPACGVDRAGDGLSQLSRVHAGKIYFPDRPIRE